MSTNLFARTTLVLTHMKTLRSRRTKLDNEIAREQHRLDPNHQHLHWLEIRRSMISDQIQRYDTILKNLKAALLQGNDAKVTHS